MTHKKIPSIARMRKKHTPRQPTEASADEGRRLVAEQSLRDALVAGLIVIVLFGILWAMLSTLLDRIFPWMTLVLGIAIGLVVRSAGNGLDWRFPVLSALMALIGALAGNVVVAAAFTARALETSALTVLRAVTSMTWPVFFEEAMTPADLAYALIAAGLAAFYANRRLTRAEYLALRKWQEKQRDAG